jgi:glucose/arabinose dehydrogenase
MHGYPRPMGRALWRRGVAAVSVLAAVLIVAGSLTEAGHADTPGPVQLVSIGTFASPTFVTAPPGDTSRVFVVEKPGKVQVVQGGVSSTFLDITSRVATGGQEQGLLSIAFDPNYATNGLLYADYTAAPNGNLEVDEFHATGNAVDSGPRVVLTIPHADAANHNGGQLQFGPDGLLYIGTGDGGMENDVLHHSQDPTSLLAKILRIDPHQQGSAAYTVPASNPGPSGLRPGWAPEVYAMGFRNPWRFSFDPVTGRLVIGDVGGDINEEVDDESPAGALGANFGWSCVEGSQPGPTSSPTCLAPGTVATPPILSYPHTDGRCSITGGVVVRDSTLPAITGRYIYGDFCKGDLSSFAPPAVDGGAATGDAPLGLNVPSLSSFGVDGVGHVYATSLNGPVYRLFQSGVSDAPPVPSFTVSPNPATTGVAVKLDGSASSDPDGRVVSYAWEWTGDGKTDATGATASATFTTTGTHTITLTVTDDGGISASKTASLDVRAPAGSGGTGSSGTGNSAKNASPSTTASLASSTRVRVVDSRRIAAVLRSGLRVQVRSTTRVRWSVSVLVTRATALRLHLHPSKASKLVSIGSAPRTTLRSGTQTIAVRLRPTLRARLKRIVPIRVEVRTVAVDGTHHRATDVLALSLLSASR